MHAGSRWRSLVVVGALVATACGDATSVPPRLSATYVLERVKGRPLPAVAFEDDRSTVTIIADTLVFKPDGEVERRSTTRYVNVLLINADTIVHSALNLGYVIDGTRLTIGVIDCPPNASCIGPSTGRIDARGIDLKDAGMGEASLRFTARER